MSNDIELLEEALDLETASRQMELAHMGYNDAVETEANKTREMHELKPASWWAQTFNTDGELRRREEGTKISMALNTATKQKETFSTWKVALNPAADKFEKGPYSKIIRELKKSYQGVSGKSKSAVRSQALTGEMDERNALIWAYSAKSQKQQFMKLQTAGAQTAHQLLENTQQMQGMKKPSIFAQVFNTQSNKNFVKQKEQLLTQRAQLKEKYQGIKNEREPLRQVAQDYVLYAMPLISKLEPNHLDLKKKNEELNAPAPLGVLHGVESIASNTIGKFTGSKPKKSPQELWGIAPSSNSSYNQEKNNPFNVGHPFALDDPLRLPKPRNNL